MIALGSRHSTHAGVIVYGRFFCYHAYQQLYALRGHLFNASPRGCLGLFWLSTLVAKEEGSACVSVLERRIERQPVAVPRGRILKRYETEVPKRREGECTENPARKQIINK